MKIAITAHGENPYTAVDSRFVQADYFILYDQEIATWDSQRNTKNLENSQEEGIQAVKALASTGAKILITGHVGPKAFKMLQTLNITIYSVGEMNSTVKVEEALSAFLSNKLKIISVPNALDLKISPSQKLKGGIL